MEHDNEGNENVNQAQEYYEGGYYNNRNYNNYYNNNHNYRGGYRGRGRGRGSRARGRGGRGGRGRGEFNYENAVVTRIEDHVDELKNNDVVENLQNIQINTNQVENQTSNKNNHTNTNINLETKVEKEGWRSPLKELTKVQDSPLKKLLSNENKEVRSEPVNKPSPKKANNNQVNTFPEHTQKQTNKINFGTSQETENMFNKPSNTNTEHNTNSHNLLNVNLAMEDNIEEENIRRQ